MSQKCKLVTFNNGQSCPVLGLGSWRVGQDNFCSAENEGYQAVKDAIDAGYRHFDTGYSYGNEKELGRAFKEKIDDGTIKREDLFVTSKLWCTCHRKDLVEKTVRESLNNLGFDYIDLYLIHWPLSFKEDGDALVPMENGKPIPSNVHYREAWSAMEKCVEKGLVKSIGISNFNKRQVEEILKIAKIKPVTNQVECHAYFNQEKLKKFCETKEILLTAYSPLGAPYRAKEGDPILIEDSVIAKLAEKYMKSPSQILLRYQIQRNIIVIPKSSNKLRIMQNIAIFDFTLSKEDMDSMNTLTKDDGRMIWFVGKDLKEYPFNEPF